MTKLVVVGRAVLVVSSLASFGSSRGGAGATSPFIDDERPRDVWTSSEAGDGSTAPSGARNVDALRYDEVVQKSAHNAYSRFEPLFDQLAWHGLRSIELDIHETKRGAPAPRGDWFVYHEDLPFLRRTTCTMLSDCLGQLVAFHRAVPNHEPITLFVDLKDRFGAAHSPVELDALLARTLGRTAIVAPQDLMDRCPGATSLRQAVTGGSCSFPTMGELRGTFVVAVTGGTACDKLSAVNAYANGASTERLAFLAPSVGDVCTMHAYDERADILFVNMPWTDRAYAREARARGLLARIYGGGVLGGLDARSDFEAAWATGAQHLATNMVNADVSAWTKAGPGQHDDAVRFVHVSSGDIWDGADSFWFSYEIDPSDAVYSTFVSVPSSHVEPFAKACLMARASEDPRAPNVSVCRMFDKRAPRMQVRSAFGATTTEIAMTNIHGVSEETPAFLRLGIRARAAGSDVVAEGSSDGQSWQTIGRAFVGVALPLRGTAVSSHGLSRAKAVFGALVRGEPDEGRTRAVALPFSLGIGIGATGGPTG